VTIFPGALLQGDTVIGDRTEIGPDTRLIDCRVGDDCVIESTTGRQSVVGDGAHVGPYAVLVPGTEVKGDRVTGPFYNSAADG
jgi:bifunctional UDP-N-acetylglucosamine pyrophosphorylase/glucosamine-1-phosphate N-acetyltransferase